MKRPPACCPVVVLAALVATAGAGAQVPASERQALVDLHTALGGPSWLDDTGWLSPGGECSWFGITCSAPPARVVGIELRSNGLSGALPNVFASLPELRDLDLNGNELRGAFPASLAALTGLRDISLADDEGDGELGGVLPDLSGLAQLERLDLGGQDFEGPLPSLGSLTSLVGAGLAGNRFSGAIPPLAGLDSLVALDLSFNRLSGPIPAGVAELTALETLDLSHNREAIGDVRQRCIGPFDSGLDGGIPDLRGLPALRELDLGGNLLEGGFPRVAGLRHLELLDIQDNCLGGELPGADLATLERIAGLIASHNDFSGEIPDELGGLTSLVEWLDLSGNRLVGGIPDLSRLVHLKRLSLAANALQGEIPESLAATGILADDPDDYCDQCLGLDYNALTARNASPALRSWLAARAGEWELTQTAPPTEVRVVPSDATSAIVAWRPIEFRGFAGEDGRYLVSVAGSPLGPFQVAGDTSDPEPGRGKEINQLRIEGLSGIPLAFRVEAESEPHAWNQNLVRSLPSELATGSAGTVAVGASDEQDLGGDEARQTAVATSSNGARAVVWTEAGTGVRGRVFPPAGGAAPVFVVAADRRAHSPRVAWTGSGLGERLVVVWVSGGSQPVVRAGTHDAATSAQGSVLGRTFTVAGGGAASGGPTQEVSSGPTGEEPVVAGSASGAVVVVWSTADGVAGRTLAADGTAGGVFEAAGGGAADAEVAAARDGSFVVTWRDAQGIAGRRFAPNGSPRPVEVPRAGPNGIVETTFEDLLRLGSGSTARNPSVAISGRGEAVIVWDEEIDGRDVRGRVFERAGLPISGVLPLAIGSAGDQTEPAVRANGDGDFVVTWLEDEAAALGARARGAASAKLGSGRAAAAQGPGILGRHFDRGGVAQGDEVELGDPADEAGRPDVAIDDADRATAVYTRRRGSRSDGVFRRDFVADRPVSPRQCVPSEHQLCLAAERFEVSARFRTSSGVTGEAQATPLTADTGYFWFFEAANVELVLKVLDGCAVNGAFWVFAGGLTDVEVDLEVHDTRAGTSRRYFNSLATPFQPIQDTAAFANCEGTTGSAEPARVATLAQLALTELAAAGAAASSHAGQGARAVAGSACATEGERLCVTGNRFAITVDWRSSAGASGSGQAGQLTSDTGTFWFFSSANLELVIKVLNACSINQRFWVFAAGLTDVEATLTIEDTASGAVRTYVNSLGQPFQPIQDTAAFATCP